MEDTPTFIHPPIVELVIGAQFSPLVTLTSGHFGLFWKELGGDWVEPGDGPTIEDQFELFDRPRWSALSRVSMKIEPLRFPGRFTLGNRAKDRLLQIQATRFHLNWKKQEGDYPRYLTLVAEFEEIFARFRTFAASNGLAALALNQWELTYVDAFPHGEDWGTPADWAEVLPGLFGKLFKKDGLDIELEHRAAEWSYEIRPKRGRLHIAARPGRFGKQDALIVEITARGGLGKGGAANLREGLDLGHRTAVDAFLQIVSEETQNKWGKK